MYPKPGRTGIYHSIRKIRIVLNRRTGLVMEIHLVVEDCLLKSMCWRYYYENSILVLGR